MATRGFPYATTAYQAYLIGPRYKPLPNTGDADALGRGWFDELCQARGRQLDQVLFQALAEIGGAGASAEAGPRLQISAENQLARTMEVGATRPLTPALGVYLLRKAVRPKRCG